MKLPISRLNHPSQPINDNAFMVVDKEVDGTWKTYKVRLSTMKDFILDETTYYLITEDGYPIITDNFQIENITIE